MVCGRLLLTNKLNIISSCLVRYNFHCHVKLNLSWSTRFSPL